MHYILFTTTHCNKCPAMKSFVKDKVKFSGKILDENSEDFREEVAKNNLTSAPTFIVHDKNQEIFRSSEIYEIEEFLKNKS
jgi:glutaredoxin